MITRLASRRVRRALVVAALLTVALPTALLIGGSSAGAAPSLDVYAVKAGGAGVRITVQTGYSFVVEPDAMIPRAAATIEANAVSALASPLDPGDSVDALPGVGVPTAEQDIMNGAATPNPAPSPIGGQTPPPQFTQTVDGVVTNDVEPFNPQLTVPYEHAVATYPNATGAPQRAIYPPPVPTSPNGQFQAPELPDFADPLGLVSVHDTLGEANAGPGSGVADSGVGSAVSIPALGLTIGRISSHVEVRGGAANSSGAATSTVVTTLQDVDLTTPSVPGLPPPPAPLPSGTALLHIGTLVLTATTERAPGAAQATSKSSLEASGVTVAGQSARLDQNGLTVLGQPSPLNPVAQRIVDTLSSPQCSPNPPIGVPNVGSLTSQPVMKIGLPQVQSQVTHGGNEASVSMTGPTLCVATTAPIPGTNGQVAATPTIYTVTLGDVSSSAYGISFPAEPVSLGALPPPMPETGVAGSAGNTSTVITNPSVTSTPPPTAPSQPVASRGLVAILTGGILSPRIVVTVASLAELALLATLWLSYRLVAAARADDTSPTQRMDMV